MRRHGKKRRLQSLSEFYLKLFAFHFSLNDVFILVFRMVVSNIDVQRLARIKKKVAYHVRMLHDFFFLA